MKYITIKRFKRNGMGGKPFNLPWGTVLERRDDGILYHEGRQVCVARSYTAHQHFARNDDGQGQERGRLSQAIIKTLGGTHRPGEETPEWDAVEDDSLSQSYRRQDHQDAWLWDDSFYNAPIEDLKHIAALVGVKGA